MSAVTLSRTITLACNCCTLLVASSVTRGAEDSIAFFNDFDAGSPSWELESPTTTGQITRRERTVNPTDDAGASIERLEVVCPPGESLRVAHPTDAVPVIDETRVVVRLRTNRPGVLVAARVVLPRTANGGEPPQTVVVRGSGDDAPGPWRELSIDQFPQLVARQARVLRTSADSPIDERGAYLDQVLLIVPGGSDAAEVEVDKLTVEGITGKPSDVAPKLELTGPQFPRANSAIARSVRPVRVSGTQFIVNERPSFPRIIEHNGEDFEFLARIGFNGIWLREPPTSEQLEIAQKLQIGLVAPPPTEAIPESEAAAWDAMLAWDLGRHLATSHLDVVTAQAHALRREDRQLRRPLIAAPSESLARFSRVADALLIGRRASLHDVLLRDWRRELRAAQRSARPGTPVWARVHLDHSAELTRQVRVLAPHAAATWQTPQRIAHQTQAAIDSGAHGLVFTSQQALSAVNSMNQLTIAACELMNRELRMIEPWLLGGTAAGLATCSDPDLHAAVMQRDRIRLVAVRRQPSTTPAAHSHDPSSPHTITVAGVSESSGAYVLTPGGMRLLPQNRVSGGMRIPLEDVPAGSHLVLTDDMAAITAMTRSAAQGASRAVQLARFLAIEELRQAEQIGSQLQQLPAAYKVAQQTVASAKAAIGQANLSLARGDHEAGYRHLLVARGDLAAMETHLVMQPSAAPGIVSSPLASSFSRLLDQWKLEWALAALPMGDNLLYGGDCEELSAMQSHGWTHTQYPIEGMQSTVELTSDAPQQGSRALRMVASATSQTSFSGDSATVWIASPEVPLTPGQTVEIAGWARVPQRFDCHLTITDTLGGDELAIEVGKTPDWQPFRMLRTAADSSSVQVKFALYGVGEARIDGVMIRPVLAAQARSSSARRLPAVPVRNTP
jgi:hypothetical protein